MARVVVVGGGLGGTATAARLAKLGHEVTLLEAGDRLGGAIGFLERDGYRWDLGPTATALPAVLRDLFRKSGRPLDRVLDLVPVEPVREHRFEDGAVVRMPGGSRAAQAEALREGLGPREAEQWLDYTQGFAPVWEALRHDVFEHSYSPDQAGAETRRILAGRRSLRRSVTRTFKDERLRELAWIHARLDGHDPRDVPAWAGVWAYVEQKFGVWTVPGGMGALAESLTRRMEDRRVEVHLGTTARDLVLAEGRATGVVTDGGTFDADVVVCAVDPRQLPALAATVDRTMPAMPPVISHLGLRGEVPEAPAELVLHGDPLLVVRTGGSAPDGGAAWTVMGRGRLSEDVVTALARRGLDVRDLVEVRVDRSPRQTVETWRGSPYGLVWQGRRSIEHGLRTRTPVAGVFAAGAHVAPGAGIPQVGLSAALVAEQVGRA